MTTPASGTTPDPATSPVVGPVVGPVDDAVPDFTRVVEHGRLVTAVLDDDRLTYASPAAHSVLGPLDLSADPAHLFVPAHRSRWRDLVRAARERPGRRSGPLAVRFAGRPQQSWELSLRCEVDRPERVHVACWDVTFRDAAQRDLAHRATHDALTGLPGRTLLEDRWGRARERAQRTGSRIDVFVCDVDGLKEVNDSAGHAAGDAVLRGVATAVGGELRPFDTVARMGGDEFAIVVESRQGRHAVRHPDRVDADAERLAERLRNCLAPDLAPRAVGRVRLSVGWVSDDVALSTAEVLAVADSRMYADKRRTQARRG